MTITKAKNEREVLTTLANDWYGVEFDELRPEEKDEIYCYAYDNDMVEMEVVMANVLNTIEFGEIRIADRSEVNRKFDTFLGFDLIGEWEFWQISSIDLDKDAEIVALEVEDFYDT